MTSQLWRVEYFRFGCQRILLDGDANEHLSCRVPVRWREAERLDIATGQLLQGAALLRARPQDFTAHPLERRF
jgi:hypothetical protein